MTRPQIYAHRGFSHRFPENTLLAFEQAALAGADGVEFDIHLAADGVPVVVHDLPLGRTVKGTGLVPSWRSDQLAAMDAGTHKGAEFTGIGVPSRPWAMVSRRKPTVAELWNTADASVGAFTPSPFAPWQPTQFVS